MTTTAARAGRCSTASLRAEIAWLEQLIAAAPEIIADERTGQHPRRP